jgi:cytochrome oxidase Cu insertion factor (SCO1/SenC/PrrC family)
MKHDAIRALALGAALLVAAQAAAQPAPGQPAPAFALVDLSGKPVRLADFRGRYVVLEWTNPSCPFVQKHYVSGNMQALQKRYTAEGVAWLVVNSTAASHPEFVPPAQQAAWLGKQGAAPTAAMLDPEGKVGRAYGARATPHMYVVDPNGTLIYAGAIDDKRSANPADVKTARNFVAQALDEARAGKPVSTASTPAYGCSVKYAD